jgi:HEAT repeats
MTKRPARKAVSFLLLALLTAASLGADDPKSALSTPGPTNAEIAERVRDLGRGGQSGTAALKWVESVGTPTIPSLLEALKGDNEELALYSCYALGIVGTNDPRVIGAFAAILRSESRKSVRREALSALRNSGPHATSARIQLGQLVASGTADERQLAIEALGDIGAPSLPVLSRLMQEGDRSVRLCCVWAYRKMGHVAFDSLRELLRAEDWKLRHDVLYSMATCWDVDKEPKILNKLFEDPDLMVRVDAVRLLGGWLTWLNRPPGHRPHGHSDEPEAAAILMPLREDTNPFMRYVAARTEEELIRAKQRNSHRGFRPSPEEVRRRQSAEDQLDRLGKEALPYLLQELETASGMRQLVLLEWIGDMGKRAAAAIEKLEQLPRRQGSDLDNQIQQALTFIKGGGMSGYQIDRP